jgi:hypothetical protein
MKSRSVMLSLFVAVTMISSISLSAMQEYCTDYVVVMEACPFCHSDTCDGSCQESDDDIVMVEE